MANRAAQLDAETKQRHPQATVKRRGRNFIEHDLGDGVTRWTGTIEPLHTRADSTPIDTAWVADASPWSYRIAAADYAARIKAAFNGAPLLQYTDVTTGAWVTLQPQQLNWTNDSGSVQMISAVQGVTAQLSDDLVRWIGAYGAGRDFEYQNHPKRLIKRLVLQSALPAPSAAILSGANPALQLQFIFNWSTDATVWIDGAQWNKSTAKTAKTTTNRIEFRVAGVPVFWFDAPTAYDANGEAAPGVTMRVRKAGNNLYVEVRTPYTWLQGAAYPVVVDPTLTDGYGGDVDTGKDTTLRSTNTDASYGNASALGNSVVLLGFDCSSVPATATCDNAILILYNTTTSVSNRSTTINEFLSGNGDWIEGSSSDPATDGSPTWDYKAQTGSGSGTAWAGSAGASSSGTDYSATTLGTISYIANDPVDTEYQIELTASDVADWFGLANENYGMRFAINIINWHSSESSTAGCRPKLVVDYTGGQSVVPVIMRQYRSRWG